VILEGDLFEGVQLEKVFVENIVGVKRVGGKYFFEFESVPFEDILIEV